MKHSTTVITFIASVLLTVGAQADSWDSLISRLTQTRVELESLSKEADSVQREKQADLDQWSQRKIEADAQVQRERLRKMQLTEKLKRLEGRVRAGTKPDPQAQKKLSTWLAQYESWVPTTIPFHHDARLNTLRRLKERVEKNHEPMEFVMSDFWAFVESEMKLAQTNEYQVVDVTLAGQSKKCEVARLGLMSLFVVTPDGKVLKAYRELEQWKWKDVDTASEQDSVINLVRNLKNKNDSGIYELPMEKEVMGASL